MFAQPHEYANGGEDSAALTLGHSQRCLLKRDRLPRTRLAQEDERFSGREQAVDQVADHLASSTDHGNLGALGVASVRHTCDLLDDLLNRRQERGGGALDAVCSVWYHFRAGFDVRKLTNGVTERC